MEVKLVMGLEDYFNKIDISERYALLFKIIKKREIYLTNLSIITSSGRYSTGHFLIKSLSTY